MPVIFELEREFCAVRRFTGALQAAHHDDRGRMRSVRKTRLCAAHKSGQLLVDDLDDHLRGSEAFHHLCADRLFCHGIGEILGDLVADVRLKKRKTHGAHCFFDVRLGKAALALQFFKGFFQTIG